MIIVTPQDKLMLALEEFDIDFEIEIKDGVTTVTTFDRYGNYNELLFDNEGNQIFGV